MLSGGEVGAPLRRIVSQKATLPAEKVMLPKERDTFFSHA
jgi:hypothetical protein